MSEEDFTRFERETAGISDPADEPAPGEVIPPGQKPMAEDGLPLDAFITEELVAAFFSLPGNMMARKTGHEFWRIEEEESELLGKACAPGVRYLVQKYLTSMAGPLAGLGAGLGVVYGPKVLQEQMERRKEERRRRQGYPPNPQSSSAGSAASSESADAENRQKPSDWQGVTSES